jgi:predicted nuclease of predicted toxin-antitoxin system
MKILLDECVTKQLKKELLAYEIFTVVELGLSGIRNGKLMTYCVENEFDILLTIDKNLAYQQNLSLYSLSIVVLNCTTSKFEELLEFMPSFKKKVMTFEKQRSYLLDKEIE